jgi:hypothetical protein
MTTSATSPPAVFGLLGNAGGTWTAPNGVSLGPELRELASTNHYQIVTDGQGGVFVYPPGAQINKTSSGMDAQTVAGIGGPVTSPPASLNFETDPAICSNAYVVQ